MKKFVNTFFGNASTSRTEYVKGDPDGEFHAVINGKVEKRKTLSDAWTIANNKNQCYYEGHFEKGVKKPLVGLIEDGEHDKSHAIKQINEAYYGYGDYPAHKDNSPKPNRG